jgi:hypothetical protein
MTILQANTKAAELNAKFPNLKCEVVTLWGGKLSIKTINADKANTLSEMFRGYNFTF